MTTTTKTSLDDLLGKISATTEARTVPQSAVIAIRKLSWEDWLPPGLVDRSPPLTRDELLDHLQARGVTVTEGTLRSWEQYGLVPQPRRRRHEGKTRVLYPGWAVTLVALVRALLDSGMTRDEVRTFIQASAHSAADVEDVLFSVSLQGVIANIEAWYASATKIFEGRGLSVDFTVKNRDGDTPLHLHLPAPIDTPAE
jgi:DNA-binding transcriptional MerR regulator